MKWKAKITRPEIKQGSTRLKRVFAWLPKYIDGSFIWLETYEILQMYIIATHNVIIDDETVKFHCGEFINLSARLCK